MMQETRRTGSACAHQGVLAVDEDDVALRVHGTGIELGGFPKPGPAPPSSADDRARLDDEPQADEDLQEDDEMAGQVRLRVEYCQSTETRIIWSCILFFMAGTFVCSVAENYLSNLISHLHQRIGFGWVAFGLSVTALLVYAVKGIQLWWYQNTWTYFRWWKYCLTTCELLLLVLNFSFWITANVLTLKEDCNWSLPINRIMCGLRITCSNTVLAIWLMHVRCIMPFQPRKPRAAGSAECDREAGGGGGAAPLPWEAGYVETEEEEGEGAAGTGIGTSSAAPAGSTADRQRVEAAGSSSACAAAEDLCSGVSQRVGEGPSSGAPGRAAGSGGGGGGSGGTGGSAVADRQNGAAAGHTAPAALRLPPPPQSPASFSAAASLRSPADPRLASRSPSTLGAWGLQQYGSGRPAAAAWASAARQSLLHTSVHDSRPDRPPRRVFFLQLLRVGWPVMLVWTMLELCIVALLVLVSAFGLFDNTHPSCSGFQPLSCSHTTRVLLSLFILTSLCVGAYLIIFIVFAVQVLAWLGQRSYQQYRAQNLFVRIELRIRTLGLVIFFVTYSIVAWTRRDHVYCAFDVDFMMGPFSTQGALLFVVVGFAAFYYPSSLQDGDKKLFTFWQQEFAWTEEDRTLALAMRGSSLPLGFVGAQELTSQPMFCYETAFKLLYWSDFAYGMTADGTSGLRQSQEDLMSMFQLEELEIMQDADMDVKVVLAWSATTLVAAFRGTASLKNAWVDLNGTTASHHGHGTHCLCCLTPNVHGGFQGMWLHNGYNLRVLAAISTWVENAQARGRPFKVLFTGHSLGGAMAYLASYDCQRALKLSPKELCIYTFGSPRVGNYNFVRRYHAEVSDCWAVINEDDVVPLAVKYLTFWSVTTHINHKVFVNASGDVIVRPSFAENMLLRWPCQRSLKHHMLASYYRSMLAVLQQQLGGGTKRMARGWWGAAAVAAELNLLRPGGDVGPPLLLDAPDPASPAPRAQQQGALAAAALTAPVPMPPLNRVPPASWRDAEAAPVKSGASSGRGAAFSARSPASVEHGLDLGADPRVSSASRPAGPSLLTAPCLQAEDSEGSLWSDSPETASHAGSRAGFRGQDSGLLGSESSATQLLAHPLGRRPTSTLGGTQSGPLVARPLSDVMQMYQRAKPGERWAPRKASGHDSPAASRQNTSVTLSGTLSAALKAEVSPESGQPDASLVQPAAV